VINLHPPSEVGWTPLTAGHHIMLFTIQSLRSFCYDFAGNGRLGAA